MRAPHARRFKYQYRLVYKYKTESVKRVFTSDHGFAVLSRLYRLGTVTPWLGCTQPHLKHTWTNLAGRLNLPVEEVLHLGVKQALVNYRATFPALEYIRVEARQVGQWDAVIDPMRTLPTAANVQRLKERAARADTIDNMTPAQRAAWRNA